MRAILLGAALLAAAGCRPDIAYGSYDCGPEAACPDDETCNQRTDLCESTEEAAAFACTTTDREPDNSFATATDLGMLTCASTAPTLSSCLEGGDALDMAKLTVPAGCADVAVVAVLDFPVSYETLMLTLTADDGTTVLATDAPCSQPIDGNLVEACLTAPLTAGTSYGLRVEPTGEGDCAGSCAYNRYDLTVQLTTQ